MEHWQTDAPNVPCVVYTDHYCVDIVSAVTGVRLLRLLGFKTYMLLYASMDDEIPDLVDVSGAAPPADVLSETAPLRKVPITIVTGRMPSLTLPCHMSYTADTRYKAIWAPERPLC
jgi:hypothetical protein